MSVFSTSASSLVPCADAVCSNYSYIAGTNGYSNGIVPMLRVFNNTARYVDQGGNKRPGAFAIYIEPWVRLCIIRAHNNHESLD